MNNAFSHDHGSQLTPHKQRIKASFGKAAATYDAAAEVQQQVARRLAARLAALPLPARPRILEIGCGTGFLTQALAPMLGAADWTVSDLSESMLSQAQTQIAAVIPGNTTVRYLVLDGEQPDSAACQEGYDLICASLSTQWFEAEGKALQHLSGLLAPGGYLGIATLGSDTFFEWQNAHHECGLDSAAHRYTSADELQSQLDGDPESGLTGSVQREILTQQHADGLAFIRSLKQIGAHPPVADTVPLGAGAMRQILRQFEKNGTQASYDVLYGLWQRSAVSIRKNSYFVTGTDTGIGKTLTSAIVVTAFDATYWKPFQTGLADEQGDTLTVAHLARLPASRLIAPACELQASLSPEAAAQLEDVRLQPGSIMLPETESALIVEGAGGLYVPVTADCMMIDLIGRFGLPVILVARSALGTINHTLLSLEALRARHITVAGVILSGELSPGNRRAIEQHGKVRILLEIPRLETVDQSVVAALAQQLRHNMGFESISPAV